jgi:hypothetical protein
VIQLPSKIKKTEKDKLTLAEKNRYDEIVTIQKYLAEGYAPVNIKELLHTTYYTIRRYAKGDPYKLCRINTAGMKKVNYERYREDIVGYLQQNMKYEEICEKITVDGYNGKLTQIKNYCRKLIAELGIEHNARKNSAGVFIKKNQTFDVHCVSKSDIFKYIWSDVQIDKNDVNYIFNKYSELVEIRDCVNDFRNIYIKKDTKLLENFINKYSICSVKSIKSFAKGLLTDIEAVKNSVISELSNGFVEGNNNKVKLIKRSMYGRAGLKLLRAKIILAR